MKQTAYFAGGCFWCITPSFKESEGVEDVISGYAGGDEINPTYKDVKSQSTGHRETIAVVYDPSKVTYEQLFDTFMEGVDPFDGEGQFIDRGHSYTLAVYYTDEDQRQVAQRKIRCTEEAARRRVYISVEPFKNFYPAEEEHQDYYLKHPEAFERELLESGRKNKAE